MSIIMIGVWLTVGKKHLGTSNDEVRIASRSTISTIQMRNQRKKLQVPPNRINNSFDATPANAVAAITNVLFHHRKREFQQKPLRKFRTFNIAENMN